MSWQDQAACAGKPIDFFYPWHTVEGERHYFYDRMTPQAGELCETCPVRQECLEAALALPMGEDFGVRGGTTQRQRMAMRRGLRVRVRNQGGGKRRGKCADCQCVFEGPQRGPMPARCPSCWPAAVNAKRRVRYWTDEEYRQRRIDATRAWTEQRRTG